MLIATIMTILLLGFSLPAYASVSGKVKQGDRLYKEEKYEEALEKYEEALKVEPDLVPAQYNRASALYRSGKYDKAFDSFLASFSEGENLLASRSIYNAGNSKYRRAEAMEASDPQNAMSEYKDTLEFYRKSIELSPEDEDARVNYEYALKKIKELEEKIDMPQDQKNQDQQDKQDQKNQDEQDKQDQKNQDEQDKQDQKNQDEQDKQDQKNQDQQDKQDQKNQDQQDKQDQKNQDQQDKQDQKNQDQQDKQDQKNQDQQDKQDQKNQDEQDKQDQKNQDKQNQSQGGKGQEDRDEDGEFPKSGKPDTMEQPGGEITPEEAEMLLRGQEEEEADMRAEMRKKRSAGRPKVLKNW